MYKKYPFKCLKNHLGVIKYPFCQLHCPENLLNTQRKELDEDTDFFCYSQDLCPLLNHERSRAVSEIEGLT